MDSWAKEFQGILSRLKREPGYAYFKLPVDPVELHIPLYPYLIKTPMDLGTVETKLSSRAYANQAAAAVDVLTCFNNALLFNGPASAGSDVYKSAKMMRAAFVKLFRAKFAVDPPKVGFGLKSPPESFPEEERVPLSKPNVAVLTDMLARLRGKYEKALEPFIYCVDPERYPDYYRKIADPIALSVVEAKLELFGYELYGDFAADVRRIWSNCQAYNGQDKLSRQAGKIAVKFEKYLSKALADMRSIVVIDDGPVKKAAVPKVVLPVSLPGASSRSEPTTPAPAQTVPEPSPTKTAPSPLMPETSVPDPAFTLKLELPSRPPFNKTACLNIVNKLIKDKRSQLFRDPVPDSVPGYRDVIRRPMDLKTIRGNIQAGRYESNDDFVADVAQIWDNCRTFNGSSPITDIANVLATMFERDLLPLLNAPPATTLSTPSKPPLPPAPAKSKPKAQLQPVVVNEPSAPVKLEPPSSMACNPPLLPSIPIPPTAADASLICIPSQPMTRTSSRLCSTILRSVISLDMSGDFMDPLDPALYNYHGYDDFVKRRMDLKTVRRNLDTDRYPTPNDFLNDLNLVFLNALAYPGTPLITKIAARYLYLHVETGFLEAFPGANARQNLKQPWVTAARTAINEVSAYDFGRLFAEPVNPIVFNLLEYYDRVENPRDLLTVTRRLNAGIYGAANEFLADVDLIWTNCCLYHGDSNPDLTDVAVNCRTVFLEAFDRALSGVSTSESTSTELTSLPPVTMEATVAAPLKSIAKRPAPTPAVHLIRRLKKMDTQQVFHFPVDQTLYPEYKSFVEKPMDFGTIEAKLLEGGYSKAEDFVADVRLVFQNCAAYNAEGTPIRQLGNRILAVFESHVEKTDIQASLDEIRVKLEQKREEKLRREKQKEEKKIAMQQKATKQGADSVKRKASPSMHGPPEKKIKIDSSKSKRLLPPLPAKVSDELVFKTLPPRIPMPATMRLKLVQMIRSQISSLKLVPKSMVSSNPNDESIATKTDKRKDESEALPHKGPNGIKFRLGATFKPKPKPRRQETSISAVRFDLDDDMEIDDNAVTKWDSKVQAWLETVQAGSHIACPAR